jgi:peptide chain release factor subunit 1
MKEKRVMTELLSEIRKPDGGLAAYGEGMVRRSLESGAVDKLLISEKYGKDRVSLHCESCGQDLEETVEEGHSEAELNFNCPRCGQVMELTGRKDMVQELNEVASSFGSQVVLVSTDSEEGGILLQAFGGIAAILRFRVG